jgi:hypothetical protein
MKTCIKHYHALIPQLDLITTQWGVIIEDTRSQNNLGLLRSEGERQKRQVIWIDKYATKLEKLGSV